MSKKRRQSIEIYLKAGVPVDDKIHGYWRHLRRFGHPQDIFRRALLIGLEALTESGEIPIDGIVRNIEPIRVHVDKKDLLPSGHEKVSPLEDVIMPVIPPESDDVDKKEENKKNGPKLGRMM